MPLKIIAGLGNPGARYARTRHNLGFAVLDALAGKFRARPSVRAHQALVGSCSIGGETLLLVKPQTYMNLSGRPVEAVLAAHGAGPADLIVVHDDLDSPLGRIRIRKSGGDGGHNGLRSIIDTLRTRHFIRVKVGIGRPPGGVDPAEYVLSPFGADEEDVVVEAVGMAAEAVAAIVREGPDRAMNRFNKAGPG